MTANAASAELIFLLTREKVDEAIQKILVDAGVTSIRKFASLVNDEAEMREMSKTDLGPWRVDEQAVEATRGGF